MKKLYFFILLFAAVGSLRAQDEAIFTHTIVNPFLTNPGYTGISGDHQVAFHMRNSWAGFKNAPTSYAVTWNGPVADRLGLGVMLFTETAGVLSRYRGQISYGYNFNVAKDFKLGIGLSTEFHQERVPASARDNQLYQPGDQLVEDRIEGAQWFDASMGVFGDYQNKLYFGLSTSNMIRARLNDFDNNSFAEEVFNYWMFQLGYRFDLKEHDVILEPSVFIRRARTSPFLVDLGFRASFLNQRLTGGLVYRAGSGGILGLMVGTNINTFRILYSYDVGFQRFQQYSNGSHEITVGFSFPGKSKKQAAAAAAEGPPKE
ncbi:MAG: PorP/SprF family type IX secretion system membrane protein [Saprospiraceae bacterium]|nr:PorP/SprF family type IX secretion system membrane protein [Saprospiraceae bacterium]